MGDEKLRIGIIGIGFWSLQGHIPELRSTGKAEVTAIARRNPQLLALAQETLGVEAAYTDWQTMLAEAPLDAVVVTTPHHAHAEPTIAALRHGLHVLVEKPMALTRDDAEAMAAAAEQAGKVLMVGANARGHGRWRAAKRALDAGVIGRVRQITGAYCTDTRWIWESEHRPEWVRQAFSTADPVLKPFLDEAFRWRARSEEMGGGMFVDCGAHFVDVLLWLAGAAPRAVMAATDPAGLPVDCFVSAHAQLTNGVQLSCTYGAGVSGEGAQFYGSGHLLIFGDQGIMGAEWSGYNLNDLKSLWVERGGVREPIEAEEQDISPTAAFVATVVEGAPNLCPAAEGVQAATLTEAIYRSAQLGQLITV